MSEARFELIPRFSPVLLASVLLWGCTTSAPADRATGAPSAAECDVPATDRAWIERALVAWGLTTRSIARTGPIRGVQAVFFSADCVLTSATAMAGEGPVWTARAHQGQLTLPDGEMIPAGVTSFASGEGDRAFFVMSTPSVWREAGVPGGPLGLETLMVGVLLHEAVHVAQYPTYGARMTRLSERHKLPDSFNDDSIQERFGDTEAAFASSVERETELLFAAAAAPDRAAALRLAREARALMQARHDRWYVGADAYLREAEDIWSTLEGSAQWAAYRWLVDRRGGALTPEAAMAGFGRRTRWWSQKQGFALFLVLDRFADESWKREVFGTGDRTAMQLFDEALRIA